MQTAALDRALEPIRRRIDAMTSDEKKRSRIKWAFDSMIGGSATVRSWAVQAIRGDAVNLPYAARQLEYVYEQAIQVEFADLPFADQGDPLIAWDQTVPKGARTFVWYYIEGAGSAEFFAAMGSNGLPSPTVMGAEQMGKVEPFGSKIQVRIDQLHAAAFAGHNLEAALGEVDKRGHAERLHFTAAWGREDIGLPGLLNNPQVPCSVAAEGTGNSTAWSAKTPGEIIADVLGIVNSIQVASQEKYAPTVIAMPARRIRVLMQTRISDGTSTDSGTTTIMEYLEKALKADGKTIRFRALEDLLAANASDYTDMFDGLDGDAGMIAFNDDPKFCSLVVPDYYALLPVQEVDHLLNTPTMSYMGGIKLPYPITVAIVVGI